MKNEYTVSWPLFRSWAAEGMFRGRQLALLIVFCLLGLLSLLLLVIGGGVLYLILALFCFYRAFARPFLLARRTFGRLAKFHGADSWLRTISFEADGLSIADGQTVTRAPYTDISGIREKGDQITLRLKNDTAVRLYASAFVGTDWPACRAFIESRRSGAG